MTYLIAAMILSAPLLLVLWVAGYFDHDEEE